LSLFLVSYFYTVSLIKLVMTSASHLWTPLKYRTASQRFFYWIVWLCKKICTYWYSCMMITFFMQPSFFLAITWLLAFGLQLGSRTTVVWLLILLLSVFVYNRSEYFAWCSIFVCENYLSGDLPFVVNSFAINKNVATCKIIIFREHEGNFIFNIYDMLFLIASS